ncbi:phage major capsid protein [Tepidibacter mesophilus]|uniref:phage major capsid protein n=1 Tax=Tepidibacter mesophilus TaxID=655607 RepID=UPI000C086D9E|nr:phage major capsid protein [Tepidibacter mesophilus]
MKISDEIRIKLKELNNEADALMNKEGVKAEEINNKAEEIRTMKAKLNFQIQKEAAEKADAENSINAGNMNQVEGNEIEVDNDAKYSKAFFNSLRGKRISIEDQELLQKFSNALSSSTGEDGGFLIPVDQKTAIKELKREYKSLEELVNVESVTTLTGSRNIEKDSLYTPFTEFTEGVDIPDTDTPQFVNIPYAIKDRGGILPIPNNLLADNNANLSAYLNRWLARKQVATRNKLIVDILNTKAKTAITNFDDLKSVFNETLDPAIAEMSVVVTNQTGFNWLDTQKDSQGNYLLQSDPTDKTKKLLFGEYPILKYSNKTLANDTTLGIKAPIIMGSLKEAITLFDRDAISLMSTQVGGDAFKKNRTDTRAITREDIKLVDEDAFVYGEITIE